MNTSKKIMSSFIVVGLVSLFMGMGTFASFNAQTANPGNVLASGTMTMTNVAGTAVAGSQCAASTAAGVCATLFSSASTALKPGDPDKSNTVTITYTGNLPTTSFGLYAANYQAKGAGSSSLCTAANPASKLNVQVTQGATIIFPTAGSGYGTLADFAATYSSSAAMLSLKGGTSGAGTAGVWNQNDASTFTILVNLDASADNAYQGCQSLADFVWFAQ